MRPRSVGRWKVSPFSMLPRTFACLLLTSSAALARDYERKSQFQLAVPLFFHALRLCEIPCHRSIISSSILPRSAPEVYTNQRAPVNNLAASFAQHPSHLPVITTLPGGIPDPSQDSQPAIVGREQHLQSALNWAKNARAHAVDVKGDDRTPECDEACAVSLCNMGDISLMLGKIPEARRHFERCIKMAKDMELPEALKQARAGLDRVMAQSS